MVPLLEHENARLTMMRSQETLYECTSVFHVMNFSYTTHTSTPAFHSLSLHDALPLSSDHDLLTISLQLLTQMVLTFDPENISTRCWPLNICSHVGQYECKNIWWSTCHH